MTENLIIGAGFAAAITNLLVGKNQKLLGL